MQHEKQFYIDGKWEDAQERAHHPITNPSTGDVMADVPYATAADIDRTARVAAMERAARPGNADLEPGAVECLAPPIDRIRLGRGIKIQGVDGLMVRYAQCCQPVPGDQVVGYVTQGRGISIHRADCPNLLTLSADERRVEIDWQEVEGEAFRVRLAVNADDRRGLYADLMEAISQTGTNIKGADLHTKDGSVFGTIFVEVDNLPHLAKVLKAVRRVKGVTTVERRETPPGK